MIAPDQTTFDYVKDKEFAPKGEAWNTALAWWETLSSDEDAVFDEVLYFDAADIEPMITYGTNPGMGIGITQNIPAKEALDEHEQFSYQKALDYMDLQDNVEILGKSIDYVFIGSCTNSRIEDLRLVADFVKGRNKAPHVTAWIVPGSKQVQLQAIAEGLDKVFESAGFFLREPGCSACLGMNEDKIPAGKYCVSTSNRNFEGRQGPNARTFLASPLTAAAAAVTGKVTDVRELLHEIELV
ncbi:MAG: aconitase family protein, partial [Janthinobacterium lividum]